MIINLQLIGVLTGLIARPISPIRLSFKSFIRSASLLPKRYIISLKGAKP